MVDIAGTHIAVGTLPDRIGLAATPADLNISPKPPEGKARMRTARWRHARNSRRARRSGCSAEPCRDVP
jgi:hypothetical protein